MSYDKSNLDGLVSVVTPAFNSEEYIASCINSVASQSIKVKEHIIVDDGSGDNTVCIVQKLSEEYNHIRLVRQENKGAGEARNKAISMAKGKYIAFLDSDDLWLESKLEVQIQLMEDKGYTFTYGNYLKVSSDENVEPREMEVPKEISYNELLTSCPIGCLTAVYNQNVKGKVYMSKIKRGQDWSLWLSLTKDGTKAYSYPGCLAIYNDVPNSLSKKRIRKFFNMYNIYRENNFGRLSSFLYTVLHALNVLVRK